MRVNHKHQLAAYGLLVEEAYGQAVETGFVYLATGGRLAAVSLTAGLRGQLGKTLGAIRHILEPGIKVALAYQGGFLIEQPNTFIENMPVMSLTDLAADKVLALWERSTARDLRRCCAWAGGWSRRR